MSKKIRIKLQKSIATFVAVTTIVWLSGIVAVIPVAQAVVSGDLIRGPDGIKVYVVKDTYKRWIQSPDIMGMYTHFKTWPVNSVDQATLDSYTNAWLVRADGDTKVYEINGDGTKHWLDMTAEQFTSSGRSWAMVYIINSAERDWYTTGPNVIIPPTPTPGVGLAVALAADTPASTTILAGQAIADLARFTFTNGDSTEVKVTTLKLKRTGVSEDTTLSRVYLYEGATRLTDDAAVSSGIITWTNSAGLFAVAASSAKTVTIKSNILSTATGQTAGVSVNASSDVVSNASAVTGTFPINGNIMSIASATMATFDFGTTTTPSANTSLDPQEGFTGWQNTVSVGNRAVYLKSMNFRIIGSIAYSDLKNFKLVIDGVQVGSTVTQPDANGYVLFDLSASPKKLETGSRVTKVILDVIGGSSRNFQVSLRYAADTWVTDSELAANILVRGDGTSTANAYAIHESGLQTVATGSLTISKKTDSPSGNVVNQASGATLASYELKALGEKIKVENLRVSIDSSDANTAQRFRNGALFAGGVQVGSTAHIYETNNVTAAYTEFSLGSSLIVEPGTPKTLEVKADVYDNEGTTNSVSAGDTLQVRIEIGSTNAQRMVSGGYFNAPAAVTSGNVLTVIEGSLSLTKDQSYGNQSIVVPQTNYLLGKFSLTAGTGEDVNLSTIQVDLAFADEFAAADLTNLYVKYGTKTTSVKSASAASQNWSISDTLAKNTSIAVEVYGDIATGAVVTETTADTVIPSVLVSGTTVSSGTNVYTNGNAVLAGQTITAKLAGTLTVALDNATPLAAQVVAGSAPSDGSLKAKLSATNEDLYVKGVTIRVDTNANDAAVVSLALYKAEGSGSFTQVGAAQVLNTDGTNPGYVSWVLSGTDRVKITKNGNSYLLVKPAYVSSGQTAVTGLTPKLLLADLQAEGTAILSAGGNGTSLVNSTGIIVQSNASATYVDSTADTATTAQTAASTTLVTSGVTFTPGDIIFVDENADATWDPATEDLEVVLADAGTDLTVQRGVFGLTAQAHTTGKNIYRLDNASTIRGIIGNAMTVLNTKLTLGLSSDSPSGATTGSSGKVIFKYIATAANNADDPAENKVSITRVDITTTESAATVTNLKLYPSEFDNNTTYATTCGGLTATKWRCTMNTTGGTNQVIENNSRTYIARADVGYSGAGSVEVSIATLGASDATTNDVQWSDGTTSITWVNQATSFVQGGAQTTTAASGTADATAPTVSTIVAANGTGTANTVDAADTVTITFSEVVDPTTVNSTLVPGGSVTGVAAASTGGVTGVALTAVITVTNIVTFDSGASLAADASFTTNLALDTTGKILTVTLNTGTAQAITTPAMAAGTQATTVKDVSGNAMAAVAGPTPTGSF